MLQATITIEAPPRVVREVFLNFPELATWHDKSFFTHIKVLTPSEQTRGLDLKEGDKLDVGIPGMTMQPVIMNNQPAQFSWLGSIPYIFTGKHDFDFTADPSEPNRTLFSQSEEFSGLLGFTMAFFGGKTSKGWEAVNRDLKKAAEAKWASERDSSQ